MHIKISFWLWNFKDSQWVLKINLLKDAIVFCVYNNGHFVKKCQNHTFNVNFQCQKSTDFFFTKEYQFKGRLSYYHCIEFFYNSHLIQKCIQNQGLLLILYTLLNQMRVLKNIRHKDDRMNSL